MGVSSISGWKVPQNKGQYTLKHYYCKSKIPGFVSALYVLWPVVLLARDA